MLDFMEQDPSGFGSGYSKEGAWRILKRVTLSENHTARLLRVARTYLDRRVEREFRYMALFVRRIADARFVDELEVLGRAQDDVGKRARLLAAYLRDPREGRRLQHSYRYPRISSDPCS